MADPDDDDIAECCECGLHLGSGPSVARLTRVESWAEDDEGTTTCDTLFEIVEQTWCVNCAPKEFVMAWKRADASFREIKAKIAAEQAEAE